MLTSQNLNRISFFEDKDIDNNSLDADIKLLGYFFENFLDSSYIKKGMKSLSENGNYHCILVLRDEKTRIKIEAESNGKDKSVKVYINETMRSFSDKENLVKACRNLERDASDNNLIPFSKEGLAYLSCKDHLSEFR